jgi:hypothetical protein
MTEDESETVRLRAYQIWDREGRPHGLDREHWLQALKELGLGETDRDETREAIAAQTREWDAAEEEQ